MHPSCNSPSYYIDLRPALQSEHISLDLSRHLICRMTVGNIVILAAQPRIFCSVVRRRWKRIIRETELQLCLTLNRVKKRQLAEQLERLQALQFSSKPDTDCDVLVVSPSEAAYTPTCATLYVATAINPRVSIPQPTAKGLAVVYRPFWDTFTQALDIATSHAQPADGKRHPSNSH